MTFHIFVNIAMSYFILQYQNYEIYIYIERNIYLVILSSNVRDITD